MVNIRQILKNATEGLSDTTTHVLRTAKEYRKIQRMQGARIIFADSSHMIHGLTKNDMIYADLNITKNLAKIKGLDRIFILEDKYYDADGNIVVVLSDGYHKTLNLTKYRKYMDVELKGLKPNEKANVLSFLNVENEKSDNLMHLDVKDFDVSIKLDTLDNELSKDFTDEAEKVMAATYFSLLEDTPNRTVIMLLIMGFLGGLVFGTTLCFMFILGLEVLKLLI